MCLVRHIRCLMILKQAAAACSEQCSPATCTATWLPSAVAPASCCCSVFTRAVCSARSSCSFFFAAALLFLICCWALADVVDACGCLAALPGLPGVALLLASCKKPYLQRLQTRARKPCMHALLMQFGVCRFGKQPHKAGLIPTTQIMPTTRGC